jgi:DME family drug/metabolite transporter
VEAPSEGSRYLPTLAVLAAAVLFGTTGTARALGPSGTDPVAAGASRILIGGGLLLAVQARGRGLGELRSLHRGTLLVAGVGTALYQAAFFAGVSRTGVAVGTVVAIGSGPVFTGIGGRVVLGEPMTGRWWAATALAVTGATMIALGGGEARADLAGIGLTLLAGLAYASYTLASKQLLVAGASPDAAMAAAFALGAVLMLPAFAVRPTGWLTSWAGLAVAVFLGVFPTAAAYRLFARGLVHLSSATATTLVLAEPATALVLGAAVLDERPGAVAVTGIGLVLAGVVVLTRH